MAEHPFSGTFKSRSGRFRRGSTVTPKVLILTLAACLLVASPGSMAVAATAGRPAGSPNTVQVRQVSCTGTYLRRTDYRYDNQASGTVTSGNQTQATQYLQDPPTGPTVITKTGYDGTYGRVTENHVPYDGATSDPGKYSAIVYNPSGDSHGMVTSVRTTSPTDATVTSAQTTTTELETRRGRPATVTDPNGKQTTATYDDLGRTTSVDLPGHLSGVHSATYDYAVSQTAATMVKTTTQRDITAGSGTTDVSYAYYDGWGRQIENQIPMGNNAGGRIVSVSAYDEAGRPWFTVAAAPADGTTPVLLNPKHTDVNHYQVTTYDAADRPKLVQDLTQTTVHSHTAYTYAADSAGWTDTVKVTDDTAPATQLSATETRHNSVGETTRVTQFGNGNSADATTGQPADSIATYSYTPTGELASIDTPITSAGTAGTLAHYAYTYDMLGRRTSSNDPDVGLTNYTYDASGNTVEVADAMSSDPAVGVVDTSYDILNRPVSRTQKLSSASNTLATWAYDTSANGIGRVATETSTTALGTFTHSVGQYDARGNVLQETYDYPAALTGEPVATTAKTYSYAYNQADQLTTTVYPAAANLPAETVGAGYGTDGLLALMVVSDYRMPAVVSYDNLNRPQLLMSGNNASDPNILTRYYGWSLDDRLSTLAAITGGSAALYIEQEYDYTYDANNSPTHVVGTRQDTLGGTPSTASWCYTYDHVNRLATASTGLTASVSPTTGQWSCTGGTDATLAGITGEKYDLAYAYDQARLATVANNAGSATGAASYAYPSPGGQPHAPASITTSAGSGSATGTPAKGAFTYDADGRISQWAPTGGHAINYTYDPQGNLTRTTDATTGDYTAYAYDPSGIRLARRDSNAAGTTTSTTLYLGPTEITKTSASFTARRNINSPGGTPLAVETPDGPDPDTLPDLIWLHADAQHNIRLSQDASTGVATHNTYLPYGELISAASALPGDRGYLDKPRDPNGDIRLDHRSYDPSINILTTPDPLLNLNDPQNLNPYAYSDNNPLTFSDPSGLDPIPGCYRSHTCPGGSTNCSYSGTGCANGDVSQAGSGNSSGSSWRPVHRDCIPKATCDANGNIIPQGPVTYSNGGPGLGSSFNPLDLFGSPFRLLASYGKMIASGMIGMGCVGPPRDSGKCSDHHEDLEAASSEAYSSGLQTLGLVLGVAEYGIAEELVAANGGGALVKYDADFAIGQLTKGGRGTASGLVDLAESQGWKAVQSSGGPLKYFDSNGIERLVIKRGSARTPGSDFPHVAIRNASGQRVDPYGNLVTRKSPGNHTPITWDLP